MNDEQVRKFDQPLEGVKVGGKPILTPDEFAKQAKEGEPANDPEAVQEDDQQLP